MTKMKVFFRLNVWALLIVGGCIDPYEPEVISKDHSFLVVEGFMVESDGSSYIKLSRTARLADKGIIEPEQSASLQLEGDDQSLYSLTEREEGRYSIDRLNLGEDVNYRLRISTANGKEYLSDFMRVKKSPPIDSLSWSRNELGV